MNYHGILIGAAAFLIIGIFHPLVIKGEYYFGKRIWIVFLISGIVFITLTLMVKDMLFSEILGIIGFSCLWSIHEVIEQEQRVEKGWFPKNPKRKE